MKLWADKNDRVMVVDRRKSPEVKSYISHVRNVNSQNYLYSLRGHEGENDDRLEKGLYGPLDATARDLTLEIIDILQSRKIPELDDGARREFWRFHIYNAFKRHPNAFDAYINELDIDAIAEKHIELSIEQGEDPEYVRRYVDMIDVRELIRVEGIQYARSEQNDEVLDLFGTMGIVFGIAPKGTSFILPDIAFKIRRASDPDKSEEEMWVPIHPKFAVRQYGFDGKCSRVQLSKTHVRSFNERWYSEANTVISVSDRQLISLVKRHEGARIKLR